MCGSSNSEIPYLSCLFFFWLVMDNNPTWSVVVTFYIAPFVVWRSGTIDVGPFTQMRFPLCEFGDCSANTIADLKISSHSVDATVENCCRISVPSVEDEDEDASEIFARVTKSLNSLLDDVGEEIDSMLFRRRVRNAKLHRSALILARVVKKLMLLTSYDPIGLQVAAVPAAFEDAL